MAPSSIKFVNARICKDGQLSGGAQQLLISAEDGNILPNSADADETIDLEGAILAPGFLELQTNGLRGFHFTHFHGESEYAKKLEEACQYLPSTGVTSFYPTIPTVASDEFKKILPSLKPREVASGASVLGAHAEGPYLHPSKKGAHNESLFQPCSSSPADVYGEAGTSSKIIKIATLAPENEGSETLIQDLKAKGIVVSLGHSNASYTQGLSALQAGATCLTHTLNAMAPFHHRDPGLAGLVTTPSSPSPYFSIIPDGNHLHPSVATMLFRSNPCKCILITDSIELAGMPDGTYPGHAQIPHKQTKVGSKVVIEGTETLIGGCAGLDECVRNLIRRSGCSIAEAVRCVTENVAALMGEKTRGKIEVGRRADLVVLDDEANVLKTWVAGKKVWERS